MGLGIDTVREWLFSYFLLGTYTFECTYTAMYCNWAHLGLRACECLCDD
jgi:hypothetical protein